MDDRKTLISQWHNVSNSIPSTTLDGVFFEDVISMLNTIKDHEVFKTWEQSKESIYDHITNLNNPHHESIDQFPFNIIQVLYSVWLAEGYSGTLQEFIDLLFKYILIAANVDDITKEDEEVYVPTVKAMADFIENHHNKKTSGIHEEVLDSIFFGDITDIPPAIYINKYIGVPTDIVPVTNAPMQQLPVKIAKTPTEFTITIESKYITQNFVFFNNNMLFSLNAANKKITIKDKNNNLHDFQLADLFSDTLETATEILIVMTINKNTVTIYCCLQGMYNNLPIQSNYVKYVWTAQSNDSPINCDMYIPEITDSSNICSFRYDCKYFTQNEVKRLLGSFI